ncbi:MAG: adenylate kinase [Chloroflexota bacterium]|nr:MAG: adenylate kinase [Chloroflexota bacterium]
MKRVAVVGTSGSGKTTFAATLAARLGYDHVELDALHWEAGWKMAEVEVFRSRVTTATDGEHWVCDGSYTKVRDIVWSRADTLVWLDYPLPLVLARLFRRTAQRLWAREALWNGNRESLREHFSRDSLFIWAFRQHRRNRVAYPAALAESRFAHLAIVHLRSPNEAERWISDLGVPDLSWKRKPPV